MRDKSRNQSRSTPYASPERPSIAARTSPPFFGYLLRDLRNPNRTEVSNKKTTRGIPYPLKMRLLHPNP